MLCLACASVGHPLCVTCESELRPSPPAVVAGIPVHAAFVHTGAAARLVHNLKYRRSVAAGRYLAGEMALRVPMGVDVLVPLPRVTWRRIINGIDQTTVLAQSVSDFTGIPVVNALTPPIWHRRLAGVARDERDPPTFTTKKTVSGRVCLVDDVCTSGSTIASAIAALQHEPAVALVATLARDLRSVPAGISSGGADC